MIEAVDVLIALLALTITILQWKSARLKNRETNLKSAYQRFMGAQAALDRSKKEYFPKWVDLAEENSLLLHPDWKYAGGEPLTIDRLHINIDDVFGSSAPRCKEIHRALRRAGLLPRGGLDLVTNMRVFANAGPAWSSKVMAARDIQGNYSTGLRMSLYEGEYFDYFNTNFGLGLLGAAVDPGERVDHRLRTKLFGNMEYCRGKVVFSQCFAGSSGLSVGS